ncbi:olfactory receptor class A-like protein 1 [Protopterus annectens]|uniref:olfactory receptor class A-like protein 1 n=1 Tax=Protopterus annectens TaxID=7888 RepID=UPI001CFA6C8E|nr:olfactory receptor class A-like protein 1 [Protopterus annectens]
MELPTIIKGVCFFLQTSTGILGNIIILMCYAHIAFNERKLMPIDNITSHLAFVNMIVLLTSGIPQTMTSFGLQNILNHHGCVFVIFVYATVRALSVCVTCLLSLFQSVTIAPSTCSWACLKIKIPQYLMPCSFILWVANMVMCCGLLFYTTVPQNGTVPKYTISTGYCYLKFPDEVVYKFYGALYTGRDATIVCVMVMASAYILLTLYRHNRQVKSIRSSSPSKKSTAEVKAAEIVICLVILYVMFYGIDNIIWIYMLIKTSASSEVEYLRAFFSSSYASLSPFLIISFNKKIQKNLCIKTRRVEHSRIYLKVTSFLTDLRITWQLSTKSVALMH